MKMTKTLMVAFASMFFATNAAYASVDHAGCKNSDSCCKKEKAIQLNKFKDNWFIGIGGGINTYYGNHTSYVPFGRRISPTFNFQVGKWFSPLIGFRGNFAWSNTISADLDANNPAAYKMYKGVYKTQSDMIGLNAETMFDVTNMIFGYNPDRVYSLVPYVGAGWIRNCENKADKVVASFGIINEFKLNDKFSLNLDVKASAFGESLDMAYARAGKKSDMTTSFTIGATYYFNKRGFDRVPYSQCQVKHMQDKLRKLNEENAALEEELARAKQAQPEVKEVVKTEYATSDVAIFFNINKSDLNDKDKVNLGFIAETIKKNPNKTFVITGYADNATGSAEFNEKLSAARAQSVYDTLVNEFNVNSNQLEVAHKGGVDNMFYDKKQLNRVAIITVK